MERHPLIPGVDFVAPAKCIDSCPNIGDAVEASVMAMAFSSGSMASGDVKNGITVHAEDGDKVVSNIEVTCMGRKRKYLLFGEKVCKGFDVRPYSGS
jgi:hypothetical protein